MRIYVDTDSKYMAYVVAEGGCDTREIRQKVTSMEAEYIAIAFAISEVVNKRKETIKHIEILTSKEVVAKQLSRQYRIAHSNLRHLATTIWNTTKYMDIKFNYIPGSVNLARRLICK